DELVLMIEPITLGGDKTLFPNDGETREFELTSASPSWRTGRRQPAIDVTIGHLPAGIAHGRAPSPGRPRGPAGRREEPHARGVRAEPSAAGSGCDSLSAISSAGRCGPSRREPARLWDRFFGDGTSTRPG